jgi:hypothetical protein
LTAKLEITRVPVADIIYDEIAVKEGSEALNYFASRRDNWEVAIAASHLTFHFKWSCRMPACGVSGNSIQPESKTKQSRRFCKKCFPVGKVPIFSENPNHGGGGMIARLQQQPAIDSK